MLVPIYDGKHKDVHQVVISSGLCIAHIGSRAMTVSFPDKATRMELDDVRLLIAMLKRAGVTLKEKLEKDRRG